MTENVKQLEITHTHAAGTLIEGTSRGDGSADALKTNRWRWSGHLGCWYLPHTRDQLAKDWVIDATRAALEAAGFAVAVTIDNTTRRSVDERETDKAERAGARAERLDARADRLAGESEAAWQASHRISDAIPMGQPILVGHHSERRHRRDLDRMHKLDEKSWDAAKASKQAAQRADTARRTAERSESPVTTGNRIKKLEADLRRVARKIDGYTSGTAPYQFTHAPATGEYLERLQVLQADWTEQLAYWHQVLAERTAGQPVYSKDTIGKGDVVRTRLGDWRRVVRVNTKSVSVATGHSWTDRIEYHEITDHRRANAG